MLGIPLDILPKAAVPAVAATALFAYYAAGPEIGARVAEVDFRPACEREVGASVVAERNRQAAASPAPDDGDEGDDDMAALRALLASPLYQAMRGNPLTQTMVGVAEAKLRRIEQARAAAHEAAKTARRQLDEWTTGSLARTGTVCGCLAVRAIAETRMDWALFAGTLGLVRSARIERFGETMRESDPEGTCRKGGQP